MRVFLSAACLAVASVSALADVHLPTKGTLGLSELPVRDSTVFQFGLQNISVIRAGDESGEAIPVAAESASDGATLSFEVPDGKMMVITQFEVPVLDPSIVFWLFQPPGPADSGAGWLLYDAFARDKGDGNPNFKEILSTPIVLAPGKTYQLHTTNVAVGVLARGYYLDETQ